MGGVRGWVFCTLTVQLKLLAEKSLGFSVFFFFFENESHFGGKAEPKINVDPSLVYQFSDRGRDAENKAVRETRTT